MNDFSKTQLRRLKRKLDRRFVQSREVEGRSVDYIEGWFALAQANAIFGFGGWDREMTHFERIYERSRGDVTSCSYVARIRIRVRAGAVIVVREGTGCGSATASSSGEAHDLALKAAETDATKRALATFGNPLGSVFTTRSRMASRRGNRRRRRRSSSTTQRGRRSPTISPPKGFARGLGS